MAIWKVHTTLSISDTYEVEAENRDEAEEIAEKEMRRDYDSEYRGKVQCVSTCWTISTSW